MDLNVNKTKYIVFQTTRSSHSHQNQKIIFQDQYIEIITYIKCLGISADSNLSWVFHHDELRKTMNSTGFVWNVKGLIFFRRGCTVERARADWIRERRSLANERGIDQLSPSIRIVRKGFYSRLVFVNCASRKCRICQRQRLATKFCMKLNNLRQRLLP